MPDPATMALLGSLGSSVIGSKQLGAPAPVFGMGGGGGGLLGGPSLGLDSGPDLLSLLSQTANEPQGGVTEALAQQPAPQGVPPSNGNPLGITQEFENPVDEGLLGQLGGGSSFGDKVGGFFGNIDQTFQSPSKMIGLGLLSQQNPNLGIAGLLASGLFGGGNG